MKKSLYFIVIWLVSVPCLHAQELIVSGPGVQIIKVPKVILVDQTVIGSFPVTIQAPKSAAIYFWSFPNQINVDWDDNGDNIVVNNAPKGLLKAVCKAVSFDPKAGTFSTKLYKVEMPVGDPIPPGPGPGPGPAPTELQKALAAGLVADGGATAASLAMVTKLATAAKTVADGANNPAWTTWNDVFGYWKMSVETGQGLKPTDLPNLKKAWNAYANTKMAHGTADPLTAADRIIVATEFTNLANALNQLAKGKK